MSRPEWLIPETIEPSTLKGQYESLLNLGGEVLEAIAMWFSKGEANLSLDDNAKALSRFLEQKRLSATASAHALHSLMLLEATRRSLGWRVESLLQYLDKFESETELKSESESESERQAMMNARSRGFKAILAFFSVQEHLELLFKAQRVYVGMKPSFHTCTSIVELRPVYNQQATDYSHGLICTTLEIQTRKQYDSEPEPFRFEFDLKDVELLEEELARIKKKLRILQAKLPKDVVLLNPSSSLFPLGENK